MFNLAEEFWRDDNRSEKTESTGKKRCRHVTVDGAGRTACHLLCKAGFELGGIVKFTIVGMFTGILIADI